MSASPFIIIAIDGGAASGKSSSSRILAERFNLLHVDTGSFYRHLTAELLMRAAGGKGIVVQFKGDAPAYTELLAGRIDATLTAISTAVPHVQAGKLRVLAVANEKRTPLHDAPTFVESGLPTVVGYGWYGLMAPAGTPEAIVRRLNAETNAAIADAEVRKKAEAAGLQLRGGTAPEFRAFLDAEAKKWAQVIKAANIQAE